MPVAAILLTGKVPQILKAICVTPVGKQSGLRVVHLLGKIRIDPNVDDFYKHVVEQKEANKDDETLKKGLKTIGNAGAYGPLVQLNEQPVIDSYFSKKLKQKVYLNPKLDVFSGEHSHQQDAPREIETEGPFYFPPVASLITAGGRLLLAMAQKCVEDAGGKMLFCDTDSICCTANTKGSPVKPTWKGEVEGLDAREFEPIPCLSRHAVVNISKRFETLNPYSFGGTILKVEDVNHEPSEKKPKGDPSKPFRNLWGYGISAKRYCLGEGKNFRKIVDAKAHGIGYLMSPIKRKKDEDQLAVEFWQKVLQNEGVSFKNSDAEWLDYPAMMKVPVSSPAVLGRLKGFCKPYDFVLAPVIRDGALELDEQADKPILITRFTKDRAESINAEYFNVRTGQACRITVGDSRSENVIPVRSYRMVLNAYVNNPESKFNGPDGRRCGFATRGMLQRKHVIAGEHLYCGKEIKRKLEQGILDHESNARVKMYSNERVAADESIKNEIRLIGKRELMRRGIGQHTIERALSTTVKTKTYKRILAVIESYKKKNRQ